MTLLTKSEILKAFDFKFEDVEVPAWGGTVRIRSMNGKERDEFFVVMAADGVTGKGNAIAAALLVATIIDESGAPVFTAADMDALQMRDADAIQTPAKVAMRLNGLGLQAIEEAKND